MYVSITSGSAQQATAWPRSSDGTGGNSMRDAPEVWVVIVKS